MKTFQESNLQKLRQLTAELPVLGPTDFKPHGTNKIEYTVDTGSCVGEALLNIADVAVQRVCMIAGTVFPEHSHNQFEVVVIVKGDAIHITPGMESKLSSREVYVSRPGELHKFVAITDVELIAITIPASEGYPKIGAN